MTREELMNVLEERFHDHSTRHEDISWGEVAERLRTCDKMDVLIRMEESGGEVDLVKYDHDILTFFDCAAESPEQRRSICYDEAAWKARKASKPGSSAEKIAEEIGADILSEDDYRFLQTLGDFDENSQSWLKTPGEFRRQGDGLFGNKRHGRTFVYYNGAQSYYGIRGVRCKVEI